MTAEVKAIGFVHAARRRAEDDFWGGEEARISLVEEVPTEALQGITEFSLRRYWLRKS